MFLMYGNHDLWTFDKAPFNATCLEQPYLSAVWLGFSELGWQGQALRNTTVDATFSSTLGEVNSLAVFLSFH